MTKVFDRIGALLETVIALLLGAMVVMVFGNVVLRYAFNSGIWSRRRWRAGASSG